MIKILVFLASKVVVFISVLLFSIFDFVKQYVMIEQAIAFASMCIPIFIFGATTSYSHYKIAARLADIERIYWCQFLWIFGILLIVFYCGYLFSADIFLSTMLMLFFIFSRFYSQTYKVDGRVIGASIIDSLPYLLLIMILGGLLLGVSLELAAFFAVSVSAPFMLWTGGRLLRISKFSGKLLQSVKSFYAFGLSAFLVSSVVMFCFMAPRAFAQLLVPEANLENYFLTLRFGLIVVLVYQFASIKWFSRIYKMELEEIGLWAVLILAVGISVTYFSIILTYQLGFIASSEYALFTSMYTGLWVLSSFFEYYVNRESGSRLFVFSALVVTAIVGVPYFIYDAGLGLELFAGYLGLIVLCQAGCLFFKRTRKSL